MQQIVRRLWRSYKEFSKKSIGKPSLHKKNCSNKSFPCRGTASRPIFIDNILSIEKFGQIRYKTSYNLSQHSSYKNPNIKYVNGKWILYIAVESEKQTKELSGNMGIDLGLKDLLIISHDGQPQVFPNINKSKKVRRLFQIPFMFPHEEHSFEEG